MATRLGGAIEIAAGEAEAAGQRAQCAIVRLHRNQRRLCTRQLVQLPAHGGWCVGRSLCTCLGAGLDATHTGQIATREQRGRVLAGPATGCGVQGDGAAVREHDVRAGVAAADNDRGQQATLRCDVAQASCCRRGILAVGQLEGFRGLHPAMAPVVGRQPVAHCELGCGLHRGIDRRGDVIPAGQYVTTITGHHFETHHLRDVRRVHLDRPLVRTRVHLDRARSRCLRSADETQLLHPRKHIDVAAFLGAFRIAQRVSAGGELRDRRKRGHFVKVELGQRFAVVELGGGRHPVGTVAEEALVEIELEDLVLAEVLLHLPGKQHFRELAREAVFRTEEKLSRDLLGDRRSPRDTAVAGGRQQPECAPDAAIVDTAMLVEARVLGSEEGLLEALRYLFDLDRIAPRFTEQGDQASVFRVDVEGLLHLDVAQRLDVRQLRRHRCIEDAAGDGGQQAENDDQDQRPSHQAAEPGRARAGLLGRGWAHGGAV